MEKEQVAKNLEEIAMIIKAYKPDAIPMNKLTEYMQALGYAQVFVQSQINLSHEKSTDMNLVNYHIHIYFQLHQMKQLIYHL